MYGEKINVYSGADPIHQEFIDAGLNYIRSIRGIIFAIPLYKLFPTKAYKDYEKVVRRMQRAGSNGTLYIQLATYCSHNVGKQILNRQSEGIKEAVTAGTVDETKAVGNHIAMLFFDATQE